MNPPEKGDAAGQMNAWFRWKNETDTPSGFAMQLWIAPVANTTFTPPASATADITLRRFQNFQVDPSKTYSWQVSEDGHSLASGRVKPDAAHLLTIPQVSLTSTPVTLSLQTAP